MSHNYDDFPTGATFTSALLTEVVAYHPQKKAAVNTGRFKWIINERNSRMRVLLFEQSSSVWDTVSWKKSAVKYDRELKNIFKTN